jgi:hypothetical protein
MSLAPELQRLPLIGRDPGETAESEARYRGLLEAAPDAMVVVNVGGEIVLLNARAEEQFGYRRDELVGQQVTNIIPEGFAERLIADGARSAADALAQQIGTGIELSARRKDGSEFPIEIMLSPLENAEGILVTAAIRDISVRKTAEKDLARMESRYRGLLEAAPDAMVVVNVGGEIALVNAQAEKQFGYSRDELVGQQVTNIIPEGFAERLIADGTRSAADALAQQIGTGIELVGRRKDRSEFPIEIMLSPLQSAEGTLVTAAIRNISERKNMEEQLRQSQKVEAIGRLAGGVAHDFNNILGVILGYGELAEAELDEESTVRQHVAEMMGAAQRAASLTRQLQAFSRKQNLQPKLLDLNDLVANAHKMLARVIGADLALVVRRAPELGTVRADPGQIDQILLNLAINARDAMPMGGTLTLETSNIELFENYAAEHWPVKAGRFVMLAVSDTGIGMDAETQRQIFEPFFTTKPVGQGTGLGLSTVYGIVKQSEGHIWVYSEPGCGTTFKIYFPRVEAPPDISRPSPTGGGRARRSRDDPAGRRQPGAARGGPTPARGGRLRGAAGGRRRRSAGARRSPPGTDRPAAHRRRHAEVGRWRACQAVDRAASWPPGALHVGVHRRGDRALRAVVGSSRADREAIQGRSARAVGARGPRPTARDRAGALGSQVAATSPVRTLPGASPNDQVSPAPCQNDKMFLVNLRNAVAQLRRCRRRRPRVLPRRSPAPAALRFAPACRR